MDLETKRLIIRDFKPEDASDLQEILGDAQTMAGCEPPYSPEKTRDFLERFCIGRAGAVAAVRKDSGKLIGYILFNRQPDGAYEIGWFFNRAYWRQGYAYEACQAVMDHAFERMGVGKIFAETADPVRSAGLMKKLGMTFVERQPGPAADLYLYERTQ